MGEPGSGQFLVDRVLARYDRLANSCVIRAGIDRVLGQYLVDGVLIGKSRIRMPGIKVISFDLDDTLWDAEPVLRRAEEAQFE